MSQQSGFKKRYEFSKNLENFSAKIFGQKSISPKIKISGANDISFESPYRSESKNIFCKNLGSTLTILQELNL